MRVFVSLSDMNYKEIVDAINQYENAELRLDLLDLTDEEYENIIENYKSLIVTCRKTEENKNKRIGYLLSAIENNVDFVDIDILSEKNVIKSLKKNINKSDTELIISFHDYNSTPKNIYLEKIIKKAYRLGADLVKIATKINNRKDLIRLVSLATDENVIPVGMSDMGKISRIVASLIEVPVVYTSLEGKETAEGQINYSKLQNILEGIKEIE